MEPETPAAPWLRATDLRGLSRLAVDASVGIVGLGGLGHMGLKIAHAMGVSEATVKAHMTAILRKLGANNRTQAVLLAGRLAVDPEATAEG